MEIQRRTRATLKWTPEDEYRWPTHAGADPDRSIEDTFGTQTGRCRAKLNNCGMSYRLQDEDPGSADGHKDRDWSLTATARDGTKRRLENRTSVGIAYSRATSDHAAQHGW